MPTNAQARRYDRPWAARTWTASRCAATPLTFLRAPPWWRPSRITLGQQALAPRVLPLQFAEPRRRRHAHPAVLLAPAVECHLRNAVLAAPLPDRVVPLFRLLLDRDDLLGRKLLPLHAAAPLPYERTLTYLLDQFLGRMSVQHVIDQVTSTKQESSWEEFRLLAGLLARYGSPYLSKVLDQANAHSDADVRDVADWYRKRSAATDQKEAN